MEEVLLDSFKIKPTLTYDLTLNIYPWKLKYMSKKRHMRMAIVTLLITVTICK